MKRYLSVALLLGMLTGFLTACTPDTAESTANRDKAKSASQLARYQAVQPAPAFDWSQYRQTLIDVESAQVHGTLTTTFFFNQGVTDPVKSCPSIGFAVPSTAQLTAPEQVIYDEHGNVTTQQIESSGVYTGDSSGTYVVCISSAGIRYVTYWEGFVETEGGPADWNTKTHSIETTGKPTVTTKEHK